MPDDLVPAGSTALTRATSPDAPDDTPTPKTRDPYDDRKAIEEYVRHAKRDAFGDHRTSMELLWQQVIHYLLGDQWIYLHPDRRRWEPKRLHRWIPRPVTNKLAEGQQALRAMFTAQKTGLVVRPNGQDPANVTAAATADEIHPLVREEHEMDDCLPDADFWFLACGNVFLHPWWDTTERPTFLPFLRCPACRQVVDPREIPAERQTCPMCQRGPLMLADGPLGDAGGEPIGDEVRLGRGRTDVISPFEMGLPPQTARFRDVAWTMRRRWRDREYYKQHHPDLEKTLRFSKSPTDRGLQLFQRLQHQLFITGRAGVSSLSGYAGEGVEEYEVWAKPSRTYPEGLVARLVNDKLVVNEDEGLPGPLPYRDVEGKPLFNWMHAGFERFGGRIWARGAIELGIQLQDRLNQVDSLIQLCLQRMGNPIWLELKGAEVEKFTGEPGLVVKYNTIGPQGSGKPERIPAEGPHPSSFTIRDQIVRDLEEALGTYDILKGQRPPNVEAFSALQLLVERSQSRFETAFVSRAKLYRDWFGVAIELEREFGPSDRVKALLGPNQSWAFRRFKRTQLQGAINVIVEDGSTAPKTSLGRRAAMEQARQMNLLTFQDPDERFAALEQLGLTHMAPALDAFIKEALWEQEQFEGWAQSGAAGPSPLVVKPWHPGEVHLAQHLKWLNSDRMREMLGALDPQVRQMVELTLGEHLAAHQPPPMMPPEAPAQPGGGGRALQNSNQESGAIDTLPQGANDRQAQQMAPA